MKQIYGIDLSKEKFDVNFFSKQGEMKHQVYKNTFNGICEFLDLIPKEAIIVAEHTGVYGDLLVFIASQLDVTICLESGYKIRHSMGLLKGKTDKLDAARIREYGERFSDKLKKTTVDSEEIIELEQLYSLRKQLVKERKMLLCHIEKKKQAASNSLIVNTVSKQMLGAFNESINKLERQIFELIHSHKDLFRNFDLVTSIKGIGPVTASNLIIKKKNFSRISTARKAASYAGVCPFPNASGKMVKKSRVSAMSDKELKT